MSSSAESVAPTPHVAVVVPCFNVARELPGVVAAIPAGIATIVVVNDASTDDTRAVMDAFTDPRVVAVHHTRNRGVGGAMISGYREALARGADIVVKMDGDGQMAAADLPRLLEPIARGRADYVKGNRFRDFDALGAMPRLRIAGNGVLSFLTKLVSGYWSLLDPTNGYTAIRASVLRRLDFRRLPDGYYFETAMLVELNILGAVVQDVDMPARYHGEASSLRVTRVAAQFPYQLFRSLARRFLWRYILQDFNVLTLCVLVGVPSVLFGVCFGSIRWWQSIQSGIPATAGTTFVAALPIILGFQCLLVALVLDMLYQPRRVED